MLQDMMHPPEQRLSEEFSSPLSTQFLEFCDSDLFPQTLQNSEVASTSNCNHEDQYSNSYTTNLSFTTTTTPTTAASSAANLSLFFDSSEETDNDISASIDFTSSPPFSIYEFFSNQQFDLSLLQDQIQPLPPGHDGTQPMAPSQYLGSDGMGPPHLMGPPLSTLCEDQICLSSMPLYMRLNPSSPSSGSVLDPNNTLNSYNFNGGLDSQNSGIFPMGLLQPQELEFQGDNGGFFNQDPLRGSTYNSSEIQALSNESQRMVNGGNSTTPPLASEITSLEESSFKVSKLSAEERKERIHRYMKKRNQRNFSKKIKYACRKTLADSRPRVRGRFAKNDEFGETTTTRTTCSNHEEDTDEDARSNHQVAVKEEQEMVDSSDIFAHISGLNSFRCNFPIQSWI
ncbi:hypothetical protein LguiA_001424 [Lonicera macranthoides]